VRLTLLSRAYCGLCDVMRDAVAPIAAARRVPLDVLDVDAHPALEARWGELVPVLFLGVPEAHNELCHYHYDAQRVARALASGRVDA
jgi:thioredoxin reductase (NADPH)